MNGCQAGQPGEGAVVLPLDRWLKELEISRLRPCVYRVSAESVLDAAGGTCASGRSSGKR
jgi:hypothetical protein